LSAEQLEPIRFIAELGSPLLVIAGSDDLHTSRTESEELFSAAAEPKELWVVEGARHEDFLAFDRPGYETRVVGPLERHLRTPENRGALKPRGGPVRAASVGRRPA
jgi:fermentation-respiration switch protein FrsA (DUF1100 family)